MSVLKIFFIHYEGQPGPAHAVPVSAGSVREAITNYIAMPGTAPWTKIIPDGAFIDEELTREDYDRMIADEERWENRTRVEMMNGLATPKPVEA